MLAFRALAGIGGSTGISIIGGTLADLYESEQRGVAYAWYSFAAFAPTGLGPVMFGYVAMNRGFRLVFYIIFAMAGAITVGAYFLASETRESVLLSAKAKRLREKTGENYQSPADQQNLRLSALISGNLDRPVRLFLTEPVLIAFTLWISWAWCVAFNSPGCKDLHLLRVVLYLSLLSVPLVFENIYG